MDLTVETIEKIVALAAPSILKIGGRSFSDKQLQLICQPTPEPLRVGTLNGFKDYINSNLDFEQSTAGDLMIHISSYEKVTMIDGLDQNYKRRIYITARAPGINFQFGHWMDIESFIIALQTQFAAPPIDVIRLMGLIQDEKLVKYKDDGLSQSLEVKTGLSQNSEIDVPNPVNLCPFRTFREIEQPASDFILRLKKSDRGPLAVLFEADGGAWKIEAIKRIKTWLQQQFENISIIA